MVVKIDDFARYVLLRIFDLAISFGDTQKYRKLDLMSIMLTLRHLFLRTGNLADLKDIDIHTRAHW